MLLYMKVAKEIDIILQKNDCYGIVTIYPIKAISLYREDEVTALIDSGQV